MTQHLDQLACKFFKLFAQYEYALKAMQYARPGSGGQAEPDWDRFANEVGILVLNSKDSELVEALGYLFESPPKRQILHHGLLEWQEVPNTERSAQILFSHIRRVRNNLYHGGKFNGRWFQPERSEELINRSMFVLSTLMNRHKKLAEAINGNHA